jgi:hypothetical protein
MDNLADKMEETGFTGAVTAETNATLVVIPDNQNEIPTIIDSLNAEFNTFAYNEALPSSSEVFIEAHRVVAKLKALGLKRVTVIGVGEGGALAQALALLAPKLARRLCLIDSSTRALPTRLSRMIDRIEQVLPLGLPLRVHSDSFDSRSFLHRIHCPTLVLISKSASSFIKKECELLAFRMPNAATLTLDNDYKFKNLQKALSEFLKVPTKRPQKNL